MNRRARLPHLDTGATLDYLEGRLEPARRRHAEEHLGEPCAPCRERVRALGALVESMRSDRTSEVPAFLRERALSVFAPATAAATQPGLLERLAQLLFDSLAQPMTSAARRSVGEARRLRYAMGAGTLELELETESASQRTLRGRLDHDDAALCTLEVRVAGELRATSFGESGAFVLQGLPAGALELAVVTPDGRWQLPTLEA